MRLRRRISVFSAALILLVSTASFTLKGIFTDVRFRSQNVQLLIKGTSTLHDWEMKSQKGSCDALFSLDNSDKIASLSGFSFSVPVESIKSEHTMMDNNAYKALKSNANKTITFVLSTATISQVNASAYQVKATGKLNIAGTVKETALDATITYNPADKSFTISGSKKFKMTEFGVTPPTVMFGTIKTGDEITVYYNTKIVR